MARCDGMLRAAGRFARCGRGGALRRHAEGRPRAGEVGGCSTAVAAARSDEEEVAVAAAAMVVVGRTARAAKRRCASASAGFGPERPCDGGSWPRLGVAWRRRCAWEGLLGCCSPERGRQRRGLAAGGGRVEGCGSGRRGGRAGFADGAMEVRRGDGGCGRRAGPCVCAAAAVAGARGSGAAARGGDAARAEAASRVLAVSARPG